MSLLSSHACQLSLALDFGQYWDILENENQQEIIRTNLNYIYYIIYNLLYKIIYNLLLVDIYIYICIYQKRYIKFNYSRLSSLLSLFIL